MNKNYESEIVWASKTLDKIEAVNLTQTLDSNVLRDLVKEQGSYLINVDYVVKIHVKNQFIDKEYDIFVFVDKDGSYYTTGSEILFNRYLEIAEQMEDYNDPWAIKVFQKQGKNAQPFLTCSVRRIRPDMFSADYHQKMNEQQ